ncbi:hypothetical protein, partial [Endozoicomonas sp. SESOKO4]|uniref:hypothetical protein n=1 Tax=Endozoicomonas sp. SESOKO4 TaxID=2828745 RepID=UPI002148083B
MGYELILNTKDTPLSSIPYSWPPVEVVIAVGWLLKNYWNISLSSFNPNAQQKARSMLTQGEQAFATIIVVPDSGLNKQPHPLSESFSDQVSGATTQHTSTFFTSTRH